MIISETLLDRLIASDAACVAQRLGVIAARAGNPFGAAIRHAHGAHGFRCAVIPSPSFNRVIGLSDRHADHVADMAAWLSDTGPRGRIEILPYRHGDALAKALAAISWTQTGFESLLCAIPDANEPATSVTIEIVDSVVAMETFLDTHLTGWGIDPRHHVGAKENMRGWLGLPGWTLFLARIDGVAAGTAVSHVADRIAYCADATTMPAWRARGVRSALLGRRLRRAAEAGCDIMWSRASLFSTSERNMIRAGFFQVCNIAIWRPVRS